MEDVLDGIIVKPQVPPVKDVSNNTVNDTDEKDFAGDIKAIFGEMVGDFTEDNNLVNNSYRVYEDTGVLNEELERAEGKLTEERGVSQQMRASLESYVPDEDEVLPATTTYTSEPSMVNFDATLTWVHARQDETRTEVIQKGARFVSLAMHWIKKYALEFSDEANLKGLMKKIEKQESKNAECFNEANLDIENAQDAIYQFVNTFNVDPETIDTHMHDTWSSVKRRRRILDQLVTPVIAPTLNALTMGLNNSSELREDFKAYQKRVEKVLKELLKALDGVAKGVDDRVDLSSVEGGLKGIVSDTNRYTLMLVQEGSGYDIEMTLVDDILKTGEDIVELLDDDYEDELMAIRQTIGLSYNLDDVESKTGIAIENPEALLQAMGENNAVLSSLLDALRLIIATHNSLTGTASAKNNLLTAYCMFLECLVD